MTAAPHLPGFPPGSAGSIENGRNTAVDTRSHLKQQAFLRLRRERQVEQLHRLGSRVVYELLDQLARDHGIGADLDWQLQRFAGLDPEILAAVGGDKFAPNPTRLVGGAK